VGRGGGSKEPASNYFNGSFFKNYQSKGLRERSHSREGKVVTPQRRVGLRQSAQEEGELRVIKKGGC